MARRLSYSARYEHPAEKVYRALTSRDMWEDRMDEFRKLTPRSEIEKFSLTDDEGLAVTLTQVLPRTELPPVAQTVMKKDMVITRTETLGPLREKAEGTYAASIPAGPGSLNGWQELFDTDAGSTNRRTTEVKVFLPFINGKLEQLMLVNLVDLFREEAEFTATWIAKNL